MRFIVSLASLLLMLLSGPQPALADGSVAMVADINPSGASGPRNFIAMKDVVYFSATDGVSGRELWRSDGTAAGTWLVRDINRGAYGSNPEPVAVVGDLLYFTAKDRVHGQALWRTDGTTPGTQRVSDVAIGSTGGAWIPYGIGFGNLLLFDVDHYGSAEDSGLWVTDGTSTGTYRLGPWAVSIAVIGTKAFFLSQGRLWRTDGTPAGTKRLSWSPPRTVVIAQGDGTIYLLSQTLPKSSDCDLYVTNGTPSGLRRLTAQPLDGCPSLTAAAGRAYFTMGSELWRSDGTPRTTKLIQTLTATLWETWPTDDCVWFNAWDAEGYPAELWTSDGTRAGTVRIDASPLPDARHVVHAGSLDYFAAYSIDWSSEPTTTWHLWRSDGSVAGTAQVAVLTTQGSATDEMFGAGSRVFFWFDDGVHGAELWSYAP